MYDIAKDFKNLIRELNVKELNKLKKTLINGNSKALELMLKEIQIELHKREGRN